MISISDLPELNATLNGISAVLLICGYIFIRKRNIPAHKFCMQAAFVTSVLFLVSYLTYHYHTGHKVFTGNDPSDLLQHPDFPCRSSRRDCAARIDDP